MIKRDHTYDVLIVGAGMSGLMAAHELVKHGLIVRVVDKGRGVGGRMATRRIGEATCDHGAQFMTTKDPVFLKFLEDWKSHDVVREWYRNLPNRADGYPGYRGTNGMTDIPKYLAQDIDVSLNVKVTAISKQTWDWILEFEDGMSVSAESLILTPPIPQSVALLNAGNVELKSNLNAQLTSIKYEPCIAVMATLKGSSNIPEPGGLFLQDNGPISWIADNKMKGISKAPSVTIHASTAYSIKYWDHDRHINGQELLNSAGKLLGSDVIEYQVHKWRYSKPGFIYKDRTVVLSQSPSLLLAGDAFGGPRIEGAALSGILAAQKLLELL